MVAIKKTVKNLLQFFGVKKVNQQENGELKTSLSDNDRYPNFCLNAANDLSVFKNFRQNGIYRQILEHVDVEAGERYLEEILKTKPDLINEIDKIKENDLYGNPSLFKYKTVGEINPTTLRYTKVLADILNHVGNLHGLKIAEIGAGYGGQCRIITALNQPEEYTLVDIKPALLLAKRYLDGYTLSSVINYKTMDELKKESYDLVISNYAFTELRRDIQDVYLDKIILNSKNGYITYNEITPEEFRSFKLDELLKIIPNSKVMAEEPLTSEKNCIIFW